MYINLQQSYDEMSVLWITHNNFTWRYRIKGDTITCKTIMKKVVLHLLFGLLCFIVCTIKVYLIRAMESAHLICKFAIHHDWLNYMTVSLSYIHTYIHTYIHVHTYIHTYIQCFFLYKILFTKEWIGLGSRHFSPLPTARSRLFVLYKYNT